MSLCEESQGGFNEFKNSNRTSVSYLLEYDQQQIYRKFIVKGGLYKPGKYETRGGDCYFHEMVFHENNIIINI